MGIGSSQIACRSGTSLNINRNLCVFVSHGGSRPVSDLLNQSNDYATGSVQPYLWMFLVLSARIIIELKSHISRTCQTTWLSRACQVLWDVTSSEVLIGGDHFVGITGYDRFIPSCPSVVKQGREMLIEFMIYFNWKYNVGFDGNDRNFHGGSGHL